MLQIVLKSTNEIRLRAANIVVNEAFVGLADFITNAVYVSPIYNPDYNYDTNYFLIIIGPETITNDVTVEVDLDESNNCMKAVISNEEVLKQIASVYVSSAYTLKA